jgi:hypothetical protein
MGSLETPRKGRGPATFKQQDVTRALRATIAAGIDVQRIEIDRNGKIVIVTGNQPDRREMNSEGANEWDSIH